MIIIKVSSFNGAPATGPSAQFDELGGTIGRADNNQLVLPDPERTISRVHAQVAYRNGSYTLIDRGSNAVLHNGNTLGNGRRAALRDGDRVQIGGYLLEASFGHRTGTADPFADLFADNTPVRSAPIVTTVPPDPLVRQTTVPARTAAPAPVSAIPENWNPFAADERDSAVTLLAAAAGPTRLVPGLPLAPLAREDSLDAIFGLDQCPAASTDPLANAGLGLPMAQPNTAASSDPLRSLMSTPAPLAAAQTDHVSELQTAWYAPPLQEATEPLPQAMKTTAAQVNAGLPDSTVLSWERPSGIGRVVLQPEAARALAAAALSPHHRESTSTARPAPIAAVAPTTAPATTPVAAPSPSAAAPSSSDELLAAFAEGLGVAEPPMRRLGPAEMRQLGQLLREATQGTLELLLSRTTLKREMRADMTVITVRENNPMKFSPSAEVALQYLLGDPKPGFMEAAPAMRDAFNDLRAHQLGMMAGMRSALEGVLQRFDPSTLEARITRRSGLGGVLAGSRKARLWELFQELYSQLSTEAADDFDRIFGKAFRASYESYVAELRSSR